MVTDQSGAVLPGVVVSLKHLPTGRVVEIVTGSEGVYHVPLAADWRLRGDVFAARASSRASSAA